MKFRYIKFGSYSFQGCTSCGKKEKYLYMTQSLPFVCLNCIEYQEENDPDAALGFEVFRFKSLVHQDVMMNHFDCVIDRNRNVSSRELSFKLIEIWKKYELNRKTGK
jgi:hypothetical protein